MNFVFSIPKKTKNERIFYLNKNTKFKNLRKILKKPLGLIIPLEYPFSIDYLKELLNIFKFSLIISVGDFITNTLIKNEIFPDIAIIDKKVKKKFFKEKFKENFFSKIFYAKNPPRKITNEAYLTIKNALSKKNSLVLIKGEEDLLVLPLILESKLNSLILYGLPNLGIVAVLCNKNKKIYIKKIFSKGISNAK